MGLMIWGGGGERVVKRDLVSTNVLVLTHFLGRQLKIMSCIVIQVGMHYEVGMHCWVCIAGYGISPIYVCQNWHYS